MQKLVLRVFYLELPLKASLLTQTAPSRLWGAEGPMGREVEIANWIRSQPALEMFNMEPLQPMTIHLHGNGNPLIEIAKISKYCFHDWSEGDKVGGGAMVFFEFDRHDSRYDNMASMLLCFINAIQWHLPNLQDPEELQFLKDTRSFTIPDLYRIYKSYRSNLTDIVFFISCFDQCPSDQRAWFLEQMHAEQSYSEWPYRLIVTTSSAEGLGVASLLSTINIEECPALSPKDLAESRMKGLLDELETLLSKRPILATFQEDIRDVLNQCSLQPYVGFGLMGCLASHRRGLTKEHIKETIHRLSKPSAEKLLQATISCVHETERRKRAGLVFNWVKHAAEPWTVDALAEAVTLAFTHPGNDCAPYEDLNSSDLVRELIADFGGILVVTKDLEVVFTHRDFYDIAEIDVEGDSDERGCRVHGEIAESCLRYFWLAQARERSFSLDPSLMERGPWQTPLDAVPMGFQRLGGMGRYATLFWPKHYRASGDFGPSELVLRLLTERQVRGIWEVPFYTLSNPFTRMQRSYLSPLPTLVMLGLGRLAMKQLEMDESQPNFEEDCWLAVAEAARADSPEILGHLLKRVTLEGDHNRKHLEHGLFWAAASGTTKRGAADVLLDWIPDSFAISWSPAVVHRAAAAGLEKMLERIFCSDYDLSTPSKYWQSPITNVAAWWDQPCSVKLLSSRGSDFNHDETDDRGFTALRVAVERGNPRLVEAILKSSSLGPDQMDILDKQGIVSEAVERNNHKALRLMLEAGADSNCGAKYGPDGSEPILAPLIRASSDGASECVRLLLGHGANPNIEWDSETALYKAVVSNNVEVVRLLLESEPKADISRVPESAQSLLMIAATHGYSEVAALLLKHGAEFDVQEPNCHSGKDLWWRTPLSRAAGQGHLAIVKLLLEQGARLDFVEEGSEGQTPLFAAAYESHTEIAQLLLDARADPNWRDQDGWTCLHASYDQPALIRAICEKGANIDAQSDDGTTLYLASRHKCARETLPVLLKQNPRPDMEIRCPGTNFHAESGFTALLAACYTAEAEAVEILLQEGANLEVQGANGDDAVDCVVRGGEGSAESIKCLALLLPRAWEKHGKGYRIDEKGNTSLHKVVESTALETVQYLIRETRMPIDLPNEEEYTPLACAIEKKNRPVAFHLIQLGARVNLTNPRFGSLLHLACATGQLEVVKQLYRAGADPFAVHPGYGDSLLYTALDLAAKLDDPVAARRMVRYLIDEQSFPVDQEGGRVRYTILRAAANAEERASPDSALLRTLLRREANVYVTDSQGRQAAHLAAKSWYDYALRALVKRSTDGQGEANVLSARDQFRRLPLHFAAAVIYDDTATFLLKLYGKRKAVHKEDIVDAVDADGWTPLLWAAQHGDLDTIAALVKAGASLWTRGLVQGSDTGWSALKLANFANRGEYTKELLTPKKEEGEDHDDVWDDDSHNCRPGFVRDSWCDGCFMVSEGIPSPSHHLPLPHCGRDGLFSSDEVPILMRPPCRGDGDIKKIIGKEWKCTQCTRYIFRLCFKCVRLISDIHDEGHTLEELGPMFADEVEPPGAEGERSIDSEEMSGSDDEFPGSEDDEVSEDDDEARTENEDNE